MAKLWGGRFAQSSAEALEVFSESISFDKRLYLYDIAGSIAHAKMLKSIGILSEEEVKRVISGLNQIKDEIETGQFEYDIKLEDIHMAIEARLILLIGDAGKKLHTARSRNDQVGLDTRMLVLFEADNIKQCLLRLQEVLVGIAEKHTKTVMPGYTHLQRAQVVSLAHHMMAYYSMLERDYSRFDDLKQRILTQMPLGCGALAGSTLPIDRDMTTELLGFHKPSTNSLDTVSDRDYIIEFNAAASIVMVHLSRLSEELILWNTKEFSFIEIADTYATGSSMMPQKKNPDIPELIRGKSARVIGSLVQILALLKGTPLSYNRDFQEDKESLFDAIDTVKACLSIMASLLENITFNIEALRAATKEGFMNATEAMEYLINKGIPNRDAHHIIGSAVAYSLEHKKLLEELTLEEWSKLADRPVSFFDTSLEELLQVENCLNLRNSFAGPSPERVQSCVESAQQDLNKQKALFEKEQLSLNFT